ncbi:helix-turn-helix domain-containing protein [Actinomadura rugatobispora]|uniref:Helix-turn-helix domain-containing protein n=1 Tax=Actinomadura rugatobispora TaxID=1994 RepID=A0ABW0ZND3_9ACTN|nr:hypothetical protein GCM10010200_036230 [Actinomadura rugatobispora]
MHPDFWRAPPVRALLAARDIGGTIRLARERHGWKQADLARRAGYSASTISRLENNLAAGIDLVKIRAVCDAVAMPAQIVGELLGLDQPGGTTVVGTVAPVALEDPMRRRTLIAAAGLAVPLSLAPLDEALALLPDAGPATLQQVTRRLVRARQQWDNGELITLIDELPALLASAHHAAELSQEPSGWALIAACYDLAAEALNKVGAAPQSRITADRAVLYAARSEDPVAMASAARTLGIVLRHEGRHELAERVTLQAAGRVADAGLGTAALAATYAQMLCTSAYNAALADDRDRALDMIAEAKGAARRLPTRPGQAPGAARFRIDAPQVDLYEVGVRWALGDAGHALAAGRHLQPGMFPTPERRARLHTDMARAEWQRGHAEQAVRRLLAAHAQAPAEMGGRPAIRAMAVEVVARHPRVSGVRELAAIVGRGRA